MGTLRFDVNNLVGAKGEGSADAAKLYKSIEKLDFAIRSKVGTTHADPLYHKQHGV